MAEDIEALAVRRNTLKRQVIEWMNAEGMAGRLRNNSQAPMWADYEAAESAIERALHAVGTIAASPPGGDAEREEATQ